MGLGSSSGLFGGTSGFIPAAAADPSPAFVAESSDDAGGAVDPIGGKPTSTIKIPNSKVYKKYKKIIKKYEDIV